MTSPLEPSGSASNNSPPITRFSYPQSGAVLRGRSVSEMPSFSENTPLNLAASKTSTLVESVFKRIGQFFATVVLAIPVTLTAALFTGISIPFIFFYEKCTGNQNLEILKGCVYSMTILMNLFKMTSLIDNKEGKTFDWYNTILSGKENQGKLLLGMMPTKGLLGSFSEIKRELTEGGKKAHIIDLTESEERMSHLLFGAPATEEDWKAGGRAISYENAPAKDLKPVDVEMIDAIVETMHEKISRGENVYIHCAKGVGRSATIVAAYLAKYGGDNAQGMGADQALTYIRKQRQISLSSKQEQQVHKYIALSTAFKEVHQSFMPNSPHGDVTLWVQFEKFLEEHADTAIKNIDFSSVRKPESGKTALSEAFNSVKTHYPDSTGKDLQVWMSMHTREVKPPQRRQN